MEILLVDDNAGDTLLIIQAARDLPTPLKFHLARDSDQALLMLRDQTFQPDLVILDLNLPGLSGFAVLQQWRPNMVPVVVFSGSSDEMDAQRALDLGACQFVRKPSDFEAYQEVVRSFIGQYGRSEAEPGRVPDDNPTTSERP